MLFAFKLIRLLSAVVSRLNRSLSIAAVSELFSFRFKPLVTSVAFAFSAKSFAISVLFAFSAKEFVRSKLFAFNAKLLTTSMLFAFKLIRLLSEAVSLLNRVLSIAAVSELLSFKFKLEKVARLVKS